MSGHGVKAEVLARPLECPGVAEGVEKVSKLKIFETMIQNSGLRRIKIAANAAYQSNCCANFDGPDFFNTLSQEETLTAPRFAPRRWGLQTRSCGQCAGSPRGQLRSTWPSV